jgi:predicted transcriptional regulator
MDKRDKSKNRILEFLKKGEKTASEISIYVGLNYYKTLELLKELVEDKKIELLNFREKKYYKLKEKQ